MLHIILGFVFVQIGGEFQVPWSSEFSVYILNYAHPVEIPTVFVSGLDASYGRGAP